MIGIQQRPPLSTSNNAPLRDGTTVGEEPPGPARGDEPSQSILCRSSQVAFPSLHDEKEFLQPAGGVKLICRFASSGVILASFSTPFRYGAFWGRRKSRVLAELFSEKSYSPSTLVWPLDSGEWTAISCCRFSLPPMSGVFLACLERQKQFQQMMLYPVAVLVPLCKWTLFK